jgi:hypothetical protein
MPDCGWVARSRSVLRTLAIAMVGHSLTVCPNLAEDLMPRPAPTILSAGWNPMPAVNAVNRDNRLRDQEHADELSHAGFRSVVAPARACTG